MTFDNGYIANLSAKNAVDQQKFEIKFISKSFFDV